MAWTARAAARDVPLEECCAVSDFLDDHRPIVGLPALQSHYTTCRASCSARPRGRSVMLGAASIGE